MNLRIERAAESDIPIILDLVGKLAVYEKLSADMVATAEDFQAALFGANSVAEALIAFADDQPAGFALFFRNFSTFLGRPGLYLEDLFVEPSYRRLGIATELLTRLAGIAVERNYGRLEWSALTWNRLAVDYYEKLGATVMEEWRTFRVTGPALERLAQRPTDPTPIG